MTSVFDVAENLLEHRDSPSMDALSLQKLCFYAYGWYAHLTGESLFGEAFYAMPYGPVVGELLSAHAGQKTVSPSMISTQLDAREADPDDAPDAYQKAVIDAVWAAYGRASAHDLVELTHREDVWAQAWGARRSGSRRAEIRHEDIIDYFLDRTPRFGEHLDLPPARISRVPAGELEEMARHTQAHRPFVETIHALRAAS